MTTEPVPTTNLATFAAGCFWCVEAAFRTLAGVLAATSGYTGGTSPSPTYEETCRPDLKNDPDNHAEAVQVEFDPSRVSYTDLLDLFWRMHNPTTLYRQGNDMGTQYRSAIYYHDATQRAAAETSRAAAAQKFANPIVTQIVPAGPFHPAEDHHQDYFHKNPTAGYCSVVIAPKLHKLAQG